MLSARVLYEPYNYLFNNCHFFYDFSIFVAIFGQAIILYLIQQLYNFIHVIRHLSNFAWTALSFWFVFYHKILTDPRGRSLFDMIRNPKNTDLTKKKQNMNETSPSDTPKPLKFYNKNLMVLSAPQSHGAYAHIDDKGKMTHLQATLNTIRKLQLFFDDPLRLAVAYEYVAKKRIEPPDGHLYDFIAFLALVFTFLRPVLIGYKRLLFKIWYRRISQWWCYLRGKQFIPPQKSKLFLSARSI
jgi:hypothetical protein